MNVFSSQYLLRSKWTATSPFHDEVHFLVTQTLTNQNGQVDKVILQGLNNRHCFEMDWHRLEDSGHWTMGWR